MVAETLEEDWNLMIGFSFNVKHKEKRDEEMEDEISPINPGL